MNPAQHILVFALRVYRTTLSPLKTVLLGPSARCRFTPSCSEYSLQAIQRHGALPGSWLAVKRLCRCHPWGGCGPDPVPETGFRFRELQSRFFVPHTRASEGLSERAGPVKRRSVRHI